VIQEFKNIVSSFSFLSGKDVAVLWNLCSVITVDKGQTLVSAGEMDYNMYYIVSGFARVYVDCEDGEERTVYLAGPGMIVGSSKTGLGDMEGNENTVVLKNAMLLRFDFQKFREAAIKHPNLYRLQAEFLTKSLIETIERLEFHTVFSPEQRYQYLVDKRQDILQNVPLKHIASYIGITPVSLSRLRSRMHSR